MTPLEKLAVIFMCISVMLLSTALAIHMTVGHP